MIVRKTFIFGATSAIAEATARLFAADGDSFFLVARDPDKLNVLADDLRVRGAPQVVTAIADALDFDRHQTLVDDAFTVLNGLDTVLIAHGTLPDQQSCEQCFDQVRREFEINSMGVLSLLTHAANRFERQGFGTLCVISSVAGDRGRQSNYVYGAAKGAVSIFLQGLRNRLNSKGVQVLTIKPGFVDTPMTASFAKGRLWASPGQVAGGIYKAVIKKKDIVYLPWFWSPVMSGIRWLPETIFKRLRL
jgi:decaprenylphospho-beta-D-erythro-pentofuranosid-2-ulose 2-reductase